MNDYHISKQVGNIEYKPGETWNTNSNNATLDDELDEACKDTPGSKGLCVNFCNNQYRTTSGWAYISRASKYNRLAISILTKKSKVLEMAEVDAKINL